MSQRINFRQVRDRFTHIDAQLVASVFSGHPPHSQLTVRFYAWWEHPLYRQARETGATWGFRSHDDGLRDVTVFAVDPIKCQLSQRPDVTDWEFCENHPLTWVYEDHGQIFCNSAPDIPRLIERVLERGLPWVTRSVLKEYLRPQQWPAPFSLGRFPCSLYSVVREELEAAGVRLHLPARPQRRDPLIALVLNGDDYILARDFELDVPEFEHRAEWFDPRGPEGST